MNYKEAIISSMKLLATIPNTIFIGYNLRYGSKAYGTLSEVPPEKILEMPVAEALMGGVAIGMSLINYLPILIFERHDFVLLSTDAIINHLAKIKEMSRKQYNPKIIIRMTIGGTKPFYPGIQHTSNFIEIFKKYTPFTIYEPKTPLEVLQSYECSINNEATTIISETRDLYGCE